MQDYVWMIYDYDDDAYLVSIHLEAEVAIRKHAERGFGRIGKLPLGANFHSAVKAWEVQEKSEANASENQRWSSSDPTETLFVERGYCGVNFSIRPQNSTEPEASVFLSYDDTRLLRDHLNKVMPK
jgi:hypothetical protein